MNYSADIRIVETDPLEDQEDPKDKIDIAFMYADVLVS
jgi:hypothetical protein